MRRLREHVKSDERIVGDSGFAQPIKKNNSLDKNIIETVSCTINKLHRLSPTLFNGTVER
jgi:hypothetical protein